MGDMVLAVSDTQSATKRFQVSHKVLCLASPVFEKLFTSGFLEGLRLRNNLSSRSVQEGNDAHELEQIDIKEDNIIAMEQILLALHFRNTDVAVSMEPEDLANLAIHCDKYDLCRALKPWISVWCDETPEVQSSSQLGLQVLAAYLFRSENFTGITARAIKQLHPKFVSEWEAEDMMTLLPLTIKRTLYRIYMSKIILTNIDTLSDRLRHAIEKLESEVQSTEGRLRIHGSVYTMNGRMCLNCGRVHPDEAKKCHPCNSAEFIGWHCTREYRVAEYFATLQRHGLWPSKVTFKSDSLDDMKTRFTNAKADHRHQCSARSSCPLKHALDDLANRAQKIIETVKGVSLDGSISISTTVVT